MSSPSSPDQRQPAGALAFLALYVAVWTLYAQLSNEGSIHRDMIEAYAWGREFQLGYYKHPPFWAWIAGLWFEIFPRTNWAFYLLGTLNTGLGVLGAWYLAGLFTRGPYRFAAPALLMLIPFYTVQGHQFNANFMLISLWPWAAYFFVRSIDRLKLTDAVLFGVFAGASLLSKYYSALFLLSAAAASLFHPNRDRYYRSPLPYVSVAVCGLLFEPHLWWLYQHDFQTLTYVESRTAFSTGTIWRALLGFAFGSLGLGALPLIAAVATRLAAGRASGGEPPIADDRLKFAAILGLGPFVLTIVSAIVGHVRLSTNFAAPLYFLAPLLLFYYVRPRPELMARVSAYAAAGVAALALIVAPFIPRFVGPSAGRQSELPMPEIAREAAQAWRETTGARLRYVTGNSRYALGIAYYGGDNTSVLIDFDKAKSPWIDEADLRRKGFLAICLEHDEECQTHARELAGEAGKDIVLSITGKNPNGTLYRLNFRLIILPPEARPHAA